MEKLLIFTINDFADDNGMEAVFEEFFPGMSSGEIILDMYNAGLIPNEVIEEFLEND